MSAPGIIEREAQCIDYSFLSIKAGKALDLVLAGKAPGEEERVVLARAVSFLQAVANGAAFVATGHSQNEADPLDAINALDYAMEPIERLQQLLTDEDIAQFFNDVAEALEESTNHPHALTQDETRKLSFASRFFQVLYDILTAQLKKIGNDEIVDGRGFANAA
jgi:hypothetical protein